MNNAFRGVEISRNEAGSCGPVELAEAAARVRRGCNTARAGRIDGLAMMVAGEGGAEISRNGVAMSETLETAGEAGSNVTGRRSAAGLAKVTIGEPGGDISRGGVAAVKTVETALAGCDVVRVEGGGWTSGAAAMGTGEVGESVGAGVDVASGAVEVAEMVEGAKTGVADWVVAGGVGRTSGVEAVTTGGARVKVWSGAVEMEEMGEMCETEEDEWANGGWDADGGEAAAGPGPAAKAGLAATGLAKPEGMAMTVETREMRRESLGAVETVVICETLETG